MDALWYRPFQYGKVLAGGCGDPEGGDGKISPVWRWIFIAVNL